MSSFDITQLLNVMPLNVYWKDKNGVYLSCNLAQAHFFGAQDPQEIIGKTDLQLSNNLQLTTSWIKNDQKVIKDGTPIIIEETSMLDGNKITGLSCKIPFKDDLGNIAGMMGITIDITAQKKIADKLVQERKNAQIALDNIIARLPGHVYWVDKDNRYLGCNDLQAKNLGLKNRYEIIGKTNNQLPWANQAQKLDAINNIVMATGKEHLEEEPAQLADGSTRTFLSRKTPLLDENGITIGVLGISFDITDRKIIEQELLAAKDAAESASRAKTEFLANMSHDVKTPMAGLIGMANIMAEDITDRETDRQRSHIIHSCGLQVLAFFNNCIELSKMEMQEWATKEEVFSLDKLLAEIKDLFVPAAQTKKLAFDIEHDSALPEMLHGHRTSLYRVILNLIGNALKFTEQGSVNVQVRLVETLASDQIRLGIEVSDTGIGIPADKQKIIFEKLHRLTPSYEGKVDGHGIGLYIVDQYVKRMGGSIEVRSVVGEGSAFTVLLPMHVVQDSPVQEEPKKSSPSLTTTHSTPRVSISLGQDEEPPPQDAPHILLVEDNEIVQAVTKMLLNNAGFEVDIAGTGAEAVELFSPGKYGLIYMDIGLPDIDGYVVTQKIREIEKTLRALRTPIVALTGHGAVDVQAFCGEAGMQGVLSKPISPQQIKDVWRKYGKGEEVVVEGLTLLTD